MHYSNYFASFTALTVFMTIPILWLLIWFIANWRIFTKAGEAGWKSLIPVYNMYTLYRFTWKTVMFWIVFILGIVTWFLGGGNASGGSKTIVDVCTLVVAVISFIQIYKQSQAFGHGLLFTLGLIFLNPIFVLILAFGSSEYLGNPD